MTKKAPMTDEQKNPSLIALVKEYAELTGCVFRRCFGGWDFINGDKCVRLFNVPRLWGNTSVYGVVGEGRYPKYITEDDTEYLCRRLEERIETLKTTKNIMAENTKTAISGTIESSSMIVDCRLLFDDGRFYVTEITGCDIRQRVDVTREVTKAITKQLHAQPIEELQEKIIEQPNGQIVKGMPEIPEIMDKINELIQAFNQSRV